MNNKDSISYIVKCYMDFTEFSMISDAFSKARLSHIICFVSMLLISTFLMGFPVSNKTSWPQNVGYLFFALGFVVFFWKIVKMDPYYLRRKSENLRGKIIGRRMSLLGINFSAVYEEVSIELNRKSFSIRNFGYLSIISFNVILAVVLEFIFVEVFIVLISPILIYSALSEFLFYRRKGGRIAFISGEIMDVVNSLKRSGEINRP